MCMNSLVKSWVAALKMLAPENVVPLLKVILKTLLEVYTTMLTYFWWLIGFGLMLIFWPQIASLDAFLWAYFIGFVCLMVWIWALLLAARPSVELKDSFYFIRRIVYLIFLWFLLRDMTHASWGVISFIVPYFTLVFFFMLDAYVNIFEIVWSPWYALKMSGAILPVYGIVSLLWYIPIKVLFSYDNGITFLVWVLLVVPLFIVVISRLYIISLHKNYKDYYEHCR